MAAPKPKESPEVWYRPGDIIQPKETPFVKVLNPTAKGTRCDFCFKIKLALQSCKCNAMFYCDTTCKCHDSEIHAEECGFLDYFEGKHETLYFLRCVLRIYAVIAKYPQRASQEFHMHKGVVRSFNTLISHEDKLGELVKNDILDFSRSKCAGNPKFVQNFMRYAGIWKTNSMDILDENQQKLIVSVLYVQASGYNHHCKPMAIFNFVGDNQEVEVRAIHEIKSDDDPYVSYLKGFLDKGKRVKQLAQYHFVCECQLCTNDPGAKVFADIQWLHCLLTQMESSDDTDRIMEHTRDLLAKIQAVYFQYDERVVDTAFMALQILKPAAESTKQERVVIFWKMCEELVVNTFGSESKYSLVLTEMSKKLQINRSTF